MQEISGFIVGDVKVTEKNGRSLLTFDMEYIAEMYVAHPGGATIPFFRYKCAMWTGEKITNYLAEGRWVCVKGVLFLERGIKNGEPSLIMNLLVLNIKWDYDSHVTEEAFWSSGAAKSEADDFPF